MAIKNIDGERKPVPYGRLIFIAVVVAAGMMFGSSIKNSKNKIASEQILAVESQPKPTTDVLATSISKISEIRDSATDLPGTVLGLTTDAFSYVASGSAEAVKDFIFENTVLNLFKQYDNLSEKQQSQVKEYICK